MALARTAGRLLAAMLVSCLALAASAQAETPVGLLHTATATVQTTIAQAGTVPADAARAIPASVAVPGAVAATTEVVTGRTAAAVGVAGSAVERAGTAVRAVPAVAPTVHAPPHARISAEGSAASTEPPSGPQLGTQPRAVRGAPPATAAHAISSAKAPTAPYAPALRRVRLPASAAGRSVGTASGAPAIPVTTSRLLASPAGRSAGNGAEAPRRAGQTGAQPPAPAPGLGGAPSQAVAGSGGGVGLAMILAMLLLALLASFATRLRPPGEAVRDVRLLLVLERPG